MGKLYDRHDRFMGYWDKNVVYDRHRRVRGYIQDNYMLDSLGNPLGYFYNNAFYTMNGVPWAFYDGNTIRDMSGRRLARGGRDFTALLSAGLLLSDGIGRYTPAPPDYNDRKPQYAKERSRSSDHGQNKHASGNIRGNYGKTRPNNSYNDEDRRSESENRRGGNYETNGYSSPQNSRGFSPFANPRLGDSMQRIMSTGKTVLNVVGALGGQESSPYGGIKVIGNLAGRYFMSNPQAALSLLSRLSKMGLLKV